MQDAVLDHQVLRVEEEGVAELPLELSPELVERGVVLVGAALDFDGADVVAPPHEEVDLRPPFPVAPVGARVEEQLDATGPQRLGDGVLGDHPLVHGQPVQQERPIELVLRVGATGERLRHEQARVGRIQLLRREVLAHRERDVGIGRVAGDVDDARLVEPPEGLRVFAHPGVRAHGGQEILLLLLGELPRDLRVDAPDLGRVDARVLGEVVPVELQDGALDPVRLAEVRGRAVDVHRLRHAADEEVFAEALHHGPVHGLAQRLPLRERLAREFDGHGVAERPAELLEVHREHSDGFFLRGDRDVLDVLFDGDERTRLDVVVASVRDKILDELARLGTPLHLVEDDQAPALL